MTLLFASDFSHTKTGLSAKLNEGFCLHVDVLENWLVRIAIRPEKGFVVPNTWMIAPDTHKNGDVALEGRDRLSFDGFTLPSVETQTTSNSDKGIESDSWRITFDPLPLRLKIEHRGPDQGESGKWQTILQDREKGAYQWLRGQFRHFQQLDIDGNRYATRHYGLGDKTGTIDRSRRRFKCLQTDALGYDAEKSDPLYKHAPFLITDPKNAPACGLLYDTFSEISFDIASEHSNYFQPFRFVEAQEKGMVLYVIAGPKVSNIVPRLHWLTGYAAMPPRWAMGFAFSSMAHTDADNAPDVITGFARKMRDLNLPISAIHLGSGYTRKADGKRYVFKWNREKFNDTKAFFNQLRDLGYRTAANVKPVLLTSHDDFEEANHKGLFVSRENGSAAIEQFWDGEGAQLDMSNPATAAYWKKGISQTVLGEGFDGVWNDNNEAELWDETAVIHGYGQKLHAMSARPLHALQMTRTSHEAITAHKPGERPYTISRGGPIGISRYGETWSGDNETSWHSLKWNLRQGLSMSISGFPITGHDIGGFSGPSPSPQLLVRWFQMMALHPRAVMNSWKPQEAITSNLPFMHEEVIEEIRAALQLRYRFLPILYSLAWECHLTGHPIIRPMFYGHEDITCKSDLDQFMLGSNILVAPVTEENRDLQKIYLPHTKGGWFNFHTGAFHEGGQWVETPVTLADMPIFIRSGSILTLAKSWPQNSPHDPNALDILVYPHGSTGRTSTGFLDDDGTRKKGAKEQKKAATLLTLEWERSTARLETSSPLSMPHEIICPVEWFQLGRG